MTEMKQKLERSACLTSQQEKNKFMFNYVVLEFISAVSIDDQCVTWLFMSRNHSLLGLNLPFRRLVSCVVSCGF